MLSIIIFLFLFYIQTNKFLILYNKNLSLEYLKFSHDYINKEFKQPYREKEDLIKLGFISLDRDLTQYPALRVSFDIKELNNLSSDLRDRLN
jgi:hypothetical protein